MAQLMSLKTNAHNSPADKSPKNAWTNGSIPEVSPYTMASQSAGKWYSARKIEHEICKQRC